MKRRQRVERARALGFEMIALCDANGDAISAGYVQLAIDRMTPRARATPIGPDVPINREARRSES